MHSDAISGCANQANAPRSRGVHSSACRTPPPNVGNAVSAVLCGAGAVEFTYDITFYPDSMNKWPTKSLVNLAPEIIHIDFHHVRSALFGHIPNMPQQRRAWHTEPLVLNQIIHQSVLAG